MKAPARICLLGSLEERLRSHLMSHPKGHERAAVVLFRRHTHEIPDLPTSDRLVAFDVIPFEESWITSSSASHVDFDLAPLRDLFRRCEDEALVFGFVHNHPNGFPEFSDRDHENERKLLNAISNRNGDAVHLVAMLLVDGKWIARTRSALAPDVAVDVRHTLVLGDYRIHLHGIKTPPEEDAQDDVLARQAAAFGRPFVRQMKSLRIAVLGCSGTGSPTGTLLSRSGAGELLFFDPDKLANTNLNRVRGARKADIGAPKGSWLRDYVKRLDLGTAAAGYDQHVDRPELIDALATCDLIVGCTDDEIGRDVANMACYFYAAPFIDMGLGGWISKDANGDIRLRGHYGRISTVFPECGECLHCQGVISNEGIRRQYALRDDPNLTEDELRERYLTGGGEQAPGVGPFTSAVGDFAVATIFDLLSGFRRFPDTLRKDQFLIDFVLMELRSPETKKIEDCPRCGKRDFLVKADRFRLGRPMFGVRNVAL
jgi:molybdopterin-synthase adenylyltransferase